MGKYCNLPLANFVQQSILYMRISGRDYLYDPLAIGGIGWGNKENTQHISDGTSAPTHIYISWLDFSWVVVFLELCKTSHQQISKNHKT